jgi:two-component system response regulator PilR (NtrC family)
VKQAAAPRLLVVDDEPDLRMLYELTLVREGYEVDSAETLEEAWMALQQQAYAAVITDMRLPDGSGMELLQRVDANARREKCIVITAYGSAENAVEALKAGAYDYLTKPVDLRQFRSVVAAALGRAPAPVGGPAPTAPGAEAGARPRSSRPSDTRPRAPAGTAALQRLAGHSVAMQEVRKLIEKVARSMAPVLVHGESGTGKELVARAIHEVSPHAAQAFVAVNCGAIPEALLEAEFFGYRKGAFTGANEDRDGFFQAAHGGTLFLDEIGELPLSMQSKLLRVVQERAVRPLGSTAELPVNVRIVSATHKDLAAEIAASRFRQDLYYRLNVIRITVPPLRERLDDLAEICAAVIERVAGDAGVTPVPELDAAALALLRRHAFPGNVRELENMLHRALALAGGARIGAEDLELPDSAPDEARGLAAGGPGASPAPVAAAGAGPALTPLPSDLAAHLDQVEREILERALERHRFNRTAAGASLGLSLRQMRYRMARLGIGGESAAESRGDVE